ncbi:MAG: hypothetical protein LBC07_05920 [Elusimicrobiota bacterium]|jgi:hypothetical protein|nr:hypothetical protein [Elusimicrobiota bacterium]
MLKTQSQRALPAVLAISFIMTFALAAGYYFSKSLFVLALSLTSFFFAFLGLIHYATITSENINLDFSKQMEQSQKKFVLLDAIVIILFSAAIVVKGIFFSFATVNFNIANNYVLAALIVFIVNACLIFFWTNKSCKSLFIRCLIIIAVICLKELCRNFVDLSKLDFFTACFLSVLLLLEAISLIVKNVRNK